MLELQASEVENSLCLFEHSVKIWFLLAPVGLGERVVLVSFYAKVSDAVKGSI